MNLNNKASWLSAAGVGALLVAGSPVVARSQGISIQFGRGDHRIEGSRFTTMRALAHRLDEAADTAARVAGDTPQERNGRMQQRFLWAINDFARQARSFHQRMDQYASQPWDVADEVSALNLRAQQVSTQIHAANAFPETYQDWAQVTTSLNLMNRSLRGQNVTVPVAAGRGYQPFDETYRYDEGRHYEGYGADAADQRDGYVTGNSLREFRRLAYSLNVETDRLVTLAEQSSRGGERGARTLADLRHFAQRASDLSRNSGGDALNARETGTLVGQMMDDARQNDRAMRESDAFPGVDWAASIRLLEQMSTTVPRN